MTIDPNTDAHLARVANEVGTPAYVYFADGIINRQAKLKRAFEGRFALSYAVKSNPNAEILGLLKDCVEYLDVSSLAELRKGIDAGWDSKRISFTGPGKRDVELREAIASNVGELVLESVREAVAANEICRATGRKQNVALRIAPRTVPKGFGDHMAGRPSPFGLDEEDTDVEVPKILSLPHLNVSALHIYSGTQCLNPEAIVENYKNFVTLFRGLSHKHGIKPKRLIFGSGLGIPYHPGDTALDLDAVAKGIAGELDALSAEFGAELVLELGRYLVGEAGYFLTRVVSVKTSRGSRIAVCDGGMNNHLPAAGLFGMIIRRNYQMHAVGDSSEPCESVQIVGPLCTSIDRLGTNVMLPPVDVGSVIAVHNSGAYGLTASPVHFISHPVPHEVLIDDRDAGQLLRNSRASFDEALTDT